ncbi:MAG: ribonuclease III [Candidatus Marinimicrobia bacterium]|jgi:ribonuclease-3|nr:ribonuclease III [Candidatus Neomarinimicrobiota bacterium]
MPIKRLIHSFFQKFTLHPLEKSLKYHFKNKDYLTQALTHRSTISNPRKNYERLEFLGDAVIDIVISKFLIKEFPVGDEGLLTKKRSGLVQKQFLGSMGNLFNLVSYLSIDSTVNLTNEKVSLRQSANLYEALLGAIYLDGGLKPCRRIIKDTIWEHKEEAWKTKNYKGDLIEHCHSDSLETPVFLVSNVTGPEHQKMFEVHVKINGKTFPPGFGSNKKTAEQKAAENALDLLKG